MCSPTALGTGVVTSLLSISPRGKQAGASRRHLHGLSGEAGPLQLTQNTRAWGLQPRSALQPPCLSLKGTRVPP